MLYYNLFLRCMEEPLPYKVRVMFLQRKGIGGRSSIHHVRQTPPPSMPSLSQAADSMGEQKVRKLVGSSGRDECCPTMGFLPNAKKGLVSFATRTQVLDHIKPIRYLSGKELFSYKAKRRHL